MARYGQENKNAKIIDTLGIGQPSVKKARCPIVIFLQTLE